MYILAKKNVKCFPFCMFVLTWKSLFNYLLQLPINGGEGGGAGTQGRAILRSKEKFSRLLSYCCSAVILLLETFLGWMGSLPFCVSWVCAARRSQPSFSLVFPSLSLLLETPETSLGLARSFSYSLCESTKAGQILQSPSVPPKLQDHEAPWISQSFGNTLFPLTWLWQAVSCFFLHNLYF